MLFINFQTHLCSLKTKNVSFYILKRRHLWFLRDWTLCFLLGSLDFLFLSFFFFFFLQPSSRILIFCKAVRLKLSLLIFKLYKDHPPHISGSAKECNVWMEPPSFCIIYNLPCSSLVERQNKNKIFSIFQLCITWSRIEEGRSCLHNASITYCS